MKEMDNVKVIVEKDKYTEDGVHQGMYGWICYGNCTNGYWLVNFPQCGEKDDIATTSIKEEDMIKVRVLDAEENERIKAHYDALEQGKTLETEQADSDASF